jgi:C-terminal processing protease CtpA/Prc
MSGLSIVARGATLKTFEIVQVAPKSPAAEAHLQKGDVIAGINDEAAADLTVSAIRDILRHVGQCKLLVERDGKTLESTIKMRRLI